MQFLVSAGEASSDMYAAGVVNHLSSAFPDLSFYGCAGPRLQKAGVYPVVDAAGIAVVGLAEVVGHLPRIYGEFRRLVRYVERNPPVSSLLTDSPDFHLRLARHLKRLGIPVNYLVAPQVWAWRQSRVKLIRELVDKLFCLFPFEEAWFRERGVDAVYIGHPLARMVKTRLSRSQFFDKHHLASDRRLLVLLPGSRAGEAARHVPVLLETVARLQKRHPLSVVLAVPGGFKTRTALEKFREPLAALSIQVISEETWDCIGHADLALAASGTVTIEAAVLGTPMVTFYKVNPLSWHAGRHLVKAPFLSMVNLIAGRQVVPELIQHDMTAEKITASAEALLTSPPLADRMKIELAAVAKSLIAKGDPLQRVAEEVGSSLAARLRQAPVSS